MIGSRASLCCHKVTKWWMKLLRPLYKCQKLTLDEQLKAGVRLFDFTLKLTKGDKIMCFCQGLLEFEDSVRKTFYKLNKYKGVYARVQFVVENELDLPLIREYARLLEKTYKRVNFLGCYDVHGNFIYDFGYSPILEVNKKASKVAGKINELYILANFVDKAYE